MPPTATKFLDYGVLYPVSDLSLGEPTGNSLSYIKSKSWFESTGRDQYPGLV